MINRLKNKEFVIKPSYTTKCDFIVLSQVNDISLTLDKICYCFYFY